MTSDHDTPDHDTPDPAPAPVPGPVPAVVELAVKHGAGSTCVLDGSVFAASFDRGRPDARLFLDALNETSLDLPPDLRARARVRHDGELTWVLLLLP